MPRKIVPLLMAVLALGCASKKPAEMLMQYDRGAETVLLPVVEPGDYALFSTYDENPIVTYTLAPGERVGFEKGERGRVIAVAGSNKVTVEDKSYEWRFKKVKPPKK